VRHGSPALVTLAPDGPAAFRDRYELIYRHRAACPQALWQAEHTRLALLVLDAHGEAGRPWLPLMMDAYSRAVAGYTLCLEAPTPRQTALALRQAMGRKQQAAWPVCGMPDVLDVAHGRDCTSPPREQVAAALHVPLVVASVGRPQGRGKVARRLGTVHTACRAALPGSLRQGHPTTAPRLSLSELDTTRGDDCLRSDNHRRHHATGLAPIKAWLGHGWLPRMPNRREELALVLVAPSRRVRRDGVPWQGLR